MKYFSGECFCENVDFQTYGNVVGMKMPWKHKRSDGSVMEICPIDSCIASEIAYLWYKGVKTLNSCCGHKKESSWIIVYEESEALMLDLGYSIDRIAPSTRNVFGLSSGTKIPKTPYFDLSQDEKEEVVNKAAKEMQEAYMRKLEDK